MKAILFLPLLFVFSIFTPKSIAAPTAMSVNSYSELAYNKNSDGYIYKGTISLTRVGSKKKETFYLFNKKGVDYVAKSKSGPYYRLSSRMKIDNIDYTY